MTKKQVKKEFIKFLKEKDALIPFICRLTSNNKDINHWGESLSLSEYLNKQLNYYKRKSDWIYTTFLIGDAFPWIIYCDNNEDYKEGDYWYTLSRDWNEYRINNNIKLTI